MMVVFTLTAEMNRWDGDAARLGDGLGAGEAPVLVADAAACEPVLTSRWATGSPWPMLLCTGMAGGVTALPDREGSADSPAGRDAPGEADVVEPSPSTVGCC